MHGLQRNATANERLLVEFPMQLELETDVGKSNGVATYSGGIRIHSPRVAALAASESSSGKDHPLC